LSSATSNTPYFFTPSHWVINDGVVRALGEETSGVVTLCGEEGSGKTTLLREILKSLDAQSNYVISLREPKLNFTQFVEFLNEALQDVKTQEIASSPAQSLKNKILKLNDENKKCIVVIDDAQDLSDDLLRSLYRLLKVNNQNGIYLLLCGNDKFQESLNADPKLLSFRKEGFNFAPMNLPEVKSFVQQYLASISRQSDNFVDKSVFLAIYWYSAGNLRIASKLCRHILLLVSQKSILRLDRSVVDEIASELWLPKPDTPFPVDVQTNTVPDEEYPIDLGPYVPTEESKKVRPKHNDLALKLSAESITALEEKVDKKRARNKARRVRSTTAGQFLRFVKAFGIGGFLIASAVGVIALTSNDPPQGGKLYQQAYEKKLLEDTDSIEVPTKLSIVIPLFIYSNLSYFLGGLADVGVIPHSFAQSFAETSQTLDKKVFDLQVQQELAVLDLFPESERMLIRMRKAQRSLDDGRIAFEAGHYIVPAGKSAYNHFRTALIWNPGNKIALQGVKDIYDILLKKSQEARENQNWDEANKYFEIADRVVNLKEID
jgi:general secretion pathway protein A